METRNRKMGKVVIEKWGNYGKQGWDASETRDRDTKVTKDTINR